MLQEHDPCEPSSSGVLSLQDQHLDVRTLSWWSRPGSLRPVSHSIHTLDLSDNPSLGKHPFHTFTWLTQAIIQLPYLRHLSLRALNLSISSLNPLTSLLQDHLPLLLSLDLAHNPHLLTPSRSSPFTCLSNTSLDDHSRVFLAQTLALHPHLQDLRLNGCGLGAGQNRFLLALLQGNQHLRHLGLSHNAITSQGFMVLVQVLQRNPRCPLQHLDLRFNAIASDQEAALALQSLAQGLPETSCLNTVKMAQNPLTQRARFTLGLDGHSSVTFRNHSKVEQ